MCDLCRKKCKSKSGLKRHMTCKHKDVRESIDVTNEEQQCQLTADILTRMVNEVKYRLSDNKVFSKSLRDELRAYNFTSIGEETEEYSELQTIFKHLVKKRNPEKLYSMYYSTVPLNSTRYFVGLSRNAATLLSTKLADHMLAYSKEKAEMTVPTFNINLTDKEMAGLQYLGGYVLHKFHNKHAQPKTCPSSESQQSMSVLKAGKEEDCIMKESQKLTSSLSRGGLWGITKAAQTIFLKTEQYFRFLTSNLHLSKINVNEIRFKATRDLEVVSAYNTMVANAELKIDDNVAKDVLQNILDLYIRVRSFSFAKDIVQKYKMQSKRVKEKALRKEISRASKESQKERQP